MGCSVGFGRALERRRLAQCGQRRPFRQESQRYEGQHRQDDCHHKHHAVRARKFVQHGLVKGDAGRCSRKISALLAPEAFSPLLSWLVRITDISAVRCPDCRRPRSPQSPGLPARRARSQARCRGCRRRGSRIEQLITSVSRPLRCTTDWRASRSTLTQRNCFGMPVETWPGPSAAPMRPSR